MNPLKQWSTLAGVNKFHCIDLQQPLANGFSEVSYVQKDGVNLPWYPGTKTIDSTDVRKVLDNTWSWGYNYFDGEDGFKDRLRNEATRCHRAGLPGVMAFTIDRSMLLDYHVIQCVDAPLLELAASGRYRGSCESFEVNEDHRGVRFRGRLSRGAWDDRSTAAVYPTCSLLAPWIAAEDCPGQYHTSTTAPPTTTTTSPLPTTTTTTSTTTTTTPVPTTTSTTSTTVPTTTTTTTTVPTTTTTVPTTTTTTPALTDAVDRMSQSEKDHILSYIMTMMSRGDEAELAPVPEAMNGLDLKAVESYFLSSSVEVTMR